jgi:hypothetical protein
MTRNEVLVFWMLLITVMMVLNGWRNKDNPPLAILLIAIPLCGWVALMLGKP